MQVNIEFEQLVPIAKKLTETEWQKRKVAFECEKQLDNNDDLLRFYRTDISNKLKLKCLEDANLPQINCYPQMLIIFQFLR